MRPFKSIPKPDISYRLKSSLWSTNSRLAPTAPCTLIGEAKFSMGDDKKVLAQLAISIHPSLLLMALHYLEHRKHHNDPIPPWMFLLGIRYFANGFKIYAYFFDWDNVERRFRFYSVPLDERVHAALGEKPSGIIKLKVVSTLGSLRSHSCFVAEQFSDWKGPLRDKYLELSSVTAY